MKQTLKNVALGALTAQALAALVVSGSIAMGSMILLSTLGDWWVSNPLARAKEPTK
jgi:hypothetical protein